MFEILFLDGLKFKVRKEHKLSTEKDEFDCKLQDIIGLHVLNLLRNSLTIQLYRYPQVSRKGINCSQTSLAIYLVRK